MTEHLTIGGYTGREPEPDAPYGVYGVANPWYCWLAARYHNTLLPLCETAQSLIAPYEEARDEAWQMYSALSTATTAEWAAAHHRWILAENRLQEAATALQAAANRTDSHENGVALSDHEDTVYEQHLRETGHPRLNFPAYEYFDCAITAAREQATRRTAAAQTLNLLNGSRG